MGAFEGLRVLLEGKSLTKKQKREKRVSKAGAPKQIRVSKLDLTKILAIAAQRDNANEMRHHPDLGLETSKAKVTLTNLKPFARGFTPPNILRTSKLTRPAYPRETVKPFTLTK